MAIRQDLKQHWRRLFDLCSGRRFNATVNIKIAPQPIQLAQPIMPSAFFENKVINLTRGAALLDQTSIAPGQHWSFWHRVRRPNGANGFVTGRNLVNGELIAQTGGGLCQLSSLVYHLALLSGLFIIERHAHSIDIYEEQQRFTPLGADATVVWGFKDLRLYNPYPFAVWFKLAVRNGELIGEVHSELPISAHHIEFIRIPMEIPMVRVDTTINGQISQSTTYEQKQGIQVGLLRNT